MQVNSLLTILHLMSSARTVCYREISSFEEGSAVLPRWVLVRDEA